MKRGRKLYLGFWTVVAGAALGLAAGCSNGGGGGGGGPTAISGTLTGVVTNAVTGTPVAGAAVQTSPASGLSIVTDASGFYVVELANGVYDVTISKNLFANKTKTVAVPIGGVATFDAALAPTSPVVVNAGADAEGDPGAPVPLAAIVEPLDGSTVTGYAWTQKSGPAAAIAGGDTASPTITLASTAAYKAALFSHSHVLDRFMVQPINPLSLEETSDTSFEVAVTTTSGVYKDTVAVHPDLPFTVNPGLRTVPIDAPVLLHGKEQADYDWMLTTPAGSTADFDDATAQNPMFTPDLVGKYTVTESTSGATFDLYAGTWIGAITNVGVDGRPDASGCTGCHNASGVAPDNFTTWRQSGHAEIFTDNLNTSTHYSTNCFQCHLVGFNPEADNFGADDGRDYEDFLDSGLLNNPSPMNFATVVSEFRSVGRLANVQCESCHGPQGGSDIHTNSAKRDGERVDVSSAVCATCHGEPKRHARFQQWEESKHGEYELAYEEATVESRGATAGHCGRCHSAQGFIAWTSQDDLTQRIQGASGNATVPELTALGLTMDRVHPQTCAACHDPHAQGKTSGEPNTATVRISGNTPMLPSGYKADSVGRGAVCITCHNTRNGLHNDFAGNPPSFGAPHGAAQGDVLMGENAYFMIPGARSPHSLITDTCATCHMELTPPPPELSYNLAGTNHTFEASTAICAQCHGVFDPAGLKSAVMARIGDLREDLEASVKAAATAAGTIKVTPFDPDTGLSAAAITIDTTMNPITGIADVIDSAGQIAFVLEFEDPITIAWTGGPMTTTDTFGVQLRNLKDNADATLYGLDGNFVRASWNLLLIQLDGSYGIHNPGFAFDVLNASAAEDLSN